jgi:hypothetical protein
MFRRRELKNGMMPVVRNNNAARLKSIAGGGFPAPGGMMQNPGNN